MPICDRRSIFIYTLRNRTLYRSFSVIYYEYVYTYFTVEYRLLIIVIKLCKYFKYVVVWVLYVCIQQSVNLEIISVRFRDNLAINWILFMEIKRLAISQFYYLHALVMQFTSKLNLRIL